MKAVIMVKIERRQYKKKFPELFSSLGKLEHRKADIRLKTNQKLNHEKLHRIIERPFFEKGLPVSIKIPQTSRDKVYQTVAQVGSS